MEANKNAAAQSHCESDSCPSADNLSLGNLSQRFGELLLSDGVKYTPRRKRSITATARSESSGSNKSFKIKKIS